MSGTQGQPVEELAAELIAADVAKTQMLGRPAKSTVTPFIVADQTGPRWLVIGGLGLVLILLVGGGAIAIGGLGGAPASPTPTAIATAAVVAPPQTASPTPSPTQTASPTPSPTPSPSPSPVPSPSVTPPALLAVPVGNATTDSGAVIADDGVVDIAAVNISQAADGSVDALVKFVEPMPSGTNSRYVSLVVGRMEEARHGGVVAAVARYVSQRGWFWQLHEGELTMGSYDGAGATLPSDAVIVHDLAAGTFTFHVPAAELPTDAEWIYIVSYHRPEPDDERRTDEFGALMLNELPVP
ncbi:MAG: hypothetical protein WD830_09875 [Chloroflexota bacterium]